MTSKIGNLKKSLPVASGGLYPSLVPEILKIFGNDVVIQAGGGIQAHKLGTRAGARAMRDALYAAMKEIPLKEYAEQSKELKIALSQGL